MGASPPTRDSPSSGGESGAGRADAGLELRRGRAACQPCRAEGGARAVRRAGRRRRGRAGCTAFLSTALLELWQKRQDNALTLAAYRESGVCTVPSRGWRRERTAGSRTSASPLVRALMLRLVAEDEGDAPCAPSRSFAELDLERNTDMADVLARLADSRLVTIGEGSVEVSHEALLREWPRLHEWIEEDADGRRLRRPHHAGGDRMGGGRARPGRALPRCRLAAASTGAPTTPSS